MTQHARLTRWTHSTIGGALPGAAWGTGGIGLADLDGEGDMDIIRKVWNADGPNYHVDYWRNDIHVLNSGPAPRRELSP